MPSHSLDVLPLLSLAVPTALAELAELAEGWRPGRDPATPRLAASVVLCRDGPDGLEAYLLHRHARMAFAASMVVFPGGGADPVDGSDRTGRDERLLACAVRETREETGVDLVADDLVPWAHWITPVPHPIRYDTYFYLAALPPDQAASDLSTETERAQWTRPTQAVAAYRAGACAMMPPTLSILIELAGLGSVRQAIDLGRDRVIETVLPEVVRADSDSDSADSDRADGSDAASGWIFRYPVPTRRAG